MSGLGTIVPNGIVPLLSFWSFLFTKGTLVPLVNREQVFREFYRLRISLAVNA